MENSQFRGRNTTSSHQSEVCILLFPKQKAEPFSRRNGAEAIACRIRTPASFLAHSGFSDGA